MQEKRPSDACLDFERRGQSSLPEEPLLKRRKRMGSAEIDAALSKAKVEMTEEIPEDDGSQPPGGVVDLGFQPGNRERDVDEESNKTADTNKLQIAIPPGSRIPTCFMCGTKANESSPLRDENGALVVWRSYKKYLAGGEFYRKPKGEKCRICTNVYALIGFDAKHGTMDDYKQNVHAKNQVDEHAIFYKGEKIG